MIRIDPERGGILAVGGVLLAAAVAMITTRLDASWGNGVHLVVALLAFALVFGVALASPAADPPRGYQTTLALAGLALLLIVLVRLAQVLGVDEPFNSSGTVLWMALIFTGVAYFAEKRFHSIPCVLLSGLGFVVAVFAFIDWVFDPSGITTFRWIALLLIVVFAVVAAASHGSDRGNAVQSVNIVGLLLVGLSATFVGLAAAAAAAASFGGDSVSDVGFGWKAILVLGSLGVLAYAAVTRERGPGWIGLVSLLLAIAVVARPRGEATIVGWPLVLLLAAGAALALGLVPRGDDGARGAAPPPGGTAPPPSGPPAPPPSTPPTA